jgi:hypothetical protein
VNSRLVPSRPSERNAHDMREAAPWRDDPRLVGDVQSPAVRQPHPVLPARSAQLNPAPLRLYRPVRFGPPTVPRTGAERSVGSVPRTRPPVVTLQEFRWPCSPPYPSTRPRQTLSRYCRPSEDERRILQFTEVGDPVVLDFDAECIYHPDRPDAADGLRGLPGGPRS